MCGISQNQYFCKIDCRVASILLMEQLCQWTNCEGFTQGCDHRASSHAHSLDLPKLNFYGITLTARHQTTYDNTTYVFSQATVPAT